MSKKCDLALEILEKAIEFVSNNCRQRDYPEESPRMCETRR